MELLTITLYGVITTFLILRLIDIDIKILQYFRTPRKYEKH